MRRRDRELVTEAIERVGLGDVADAPVRTLSGGMQQRAFIAKALAGEPSLLVLDEPTTGVDVESQESLAALLDRLHSELGVTDPLRLARVRRRRALRAAARARPAQHRLRRPAAATFRECGTTPRTCMPECSSSSSCGSRSARARSWACSRPRSASSSSSAASRSSATASATSRSRASRPGSCSTSRRSSPRS